MLIVSMSYIQNVRLLLIADIGLMSVRFVPKADVVEFTQHELMKTGTSYFVLINAG